MVLSDVFRRPTSWPSHRPTDREEQILILSSKYDVSPLCADSSPSLGGKYNILPERHSNTDLRPTIIPPLPPCIVASSRATKSHSASNSHLLKKGLTQPAMSPSSQPTSESSPTFLSSPSSRATKHCVQLRRRAATKQPYIAPTPPHWFTISLLGNVCFFFYLLYMHTQIQPCTHTHTHTHTHIYSNVSKIP